LQEFDYSLVMHKKRVVFFDGDGIIWYPRGRKKETPPYLIYRKYKKERDYLPRLKLAYGIVKTLKKLKKEGKTLILISTMPYDSVKANKLLDNKIRYFKLDNIFHEWYAIENIQEAKGLFMVELLKEKNILKKHALIVGDSYRYDYLSAKKVNIEALLLENPYTKIFPKAKNIKTIKNITELGGCIKIGEDDWSKYPLGMKRNL